jgi:phospholipid/cholesterol/gamma-HCH transport system ATP-binding protein
LDDLILELRETLGMTIIVVTHELESAVKIADQMVVMDRGSLLAVGTPDEIRGSQDETVLRFLRREAEEQQVNTESYLSRLLGRQYKAGENSTHRHGGVR